MTKEELKEAYHKIIIPESKNAYHFTDSDLDFDLRAENPICGDRYDISLTTNSANKIKTGFKGIGCALSKASTSLLMRELHGIDTKQAQILCGNFIDALENGDTSKMKNPNLKFLLELRNFGGRLDCIKLSWEAVNDYLKKKENEN